MSLLAIAFVLACGGVVAQKAVLRGDPQRQIAAFAIDGLVPTERAADVGQPGLFIGVGARTLSPAGELAALLGGIENRTGSAVDAVGLDRLVAIGAPDWVGQVEAMLVHLRETKEKQFYVDLRVCEVTAAAATLRIGPALGADVIAAVKKHASEFSAELEGGKAGELVTALARLEGTYIVQCPQMVLGSMATGVIRVGQNVRFAQGIPQRVGVPAGVVVAEGRLWSGDDARVMVGEVAERRIGVRLDLISQTVKDPMPRVQVAVPAAQKQVDVDVPIAVAAQLAHAVAVAPGECIVAGVPKGGDWLVAFLSVTEIRP